MLDSRVSILVDGNINGARSVKLTILEYQGDKQRARDTSVADSKSGTSMLLVF